MEKSQRGVNYIYISFIFETALIGFSRNVVNIFYFEWENSLRRLSRTKTVLKYVTMETSLKLIFISAKNNYDVLFFCDI